MKANITKSKTLRFGALVLTAGALVTMTSCGSSNVDSLFFTVKNNKGFEVTFCDRGASIYSIKLKNKYMTYHPQDKNVFVGNNYYGTCLGRVAGRFPDGKLRIGEKEYQLEINETQRGKNNCLHGGTNGLSTKDWTHEVVEKNKYYEVIFKYVSGPGESGFPETLNVKYTYKVYKEEAKLDVVMDAGASGLTPVDLSMHTFFRLGGGDLTSHTLTINADKLAKYDDDGCQTVVGTKSVGEDPREGRGLWDFRNGKEISKEDLAAVATLDPASNGYDHIWYFGDNAEATGPKTVNVELKGNGYSLNVTSEDSDAVILYANCWPVKGQKMNAGEEDTQYAAITIEPYNFFTTEQKSIEKLFINREHSFSRHITYEFNQI
ncbi:MAG: hypothetical protein MJ207_00875 [Bacilli bacterium]|nr:hypothetical protein [Bacilli bacterium]